MFCKVKETFAKSMLMVRAWQGWLASLHAECLADTTNNTSVDMET